MASLIAPPFASLEPQSSAVQCGDWMVVSASQTTPLGVHLANWDYSSRVTLHRDMSIDATALRKAVDLGERARIKVVAEWSSFGAWRVSGVLAEASLELSDGAHHSFALKGLLEGQDISRQFSVTTVIAVMDPGKAPGDLAPSYPGSTIWRSEDDVIVEGSGSRMPVALVDFKQYETQEQGARWTVRLEPDWLSQHPSFALAVLVNKADQVAVAAATKPWDAMSEVERDVRRQMLVDVARLMLIRALRDEEFLASSSEFQARSAGGSVRALIRSRFSGYSPSELSQVMNAEPERFERMVQTAFRSAEGR